MDEEILKNVFGYIGKAFTGLKPTFAFVFSCACYVIFPDDLHLWALVAVLVASLMDIFTKSYAICMTNGGYKNAVKIKRLFSKNLWKGTEIKIVSYLSIAILTGISYRVIYLKEVGIIFASFIYTVMFMREFQSNVENLIEAGADLHWLLLWSKKKNKDLMREVEKDESDKPDETEITNEGIEEEVVEDYEQRI
ncbi:MAG TPA: hypothetical protein GX707_09825 [Epulopiscium sp.]|nr:hypothetical protein [Candidatus Epulonipiscium sp.]